MKKSNMSEQAKETDIEVFMSTLKKAVTSRPAPLKPAKAKRQTSR